MIKQSYSNRDSEKMFAENAMTTILHYVLKQKHKHTIKIKQRTKQTVCP